MNDQRHYFLGIDSAPSQGQRSDRGAIAALRAVPRWARSRSQGNPAGAPDSTRGGAYAPRADEDEEVPQFLTEADFDCAMVYAKVIRKADATQWSAIVHEKQQDFGFSKIVMDHGGGGQWILPELRKVKQTIRTIETVVTPITTPDDRVASQAQRILCMFTRGDPGIRMLWPDLKNARGDDLLKDWAETIFRTALEKGQVAFPPYGLDRSQKSEVRMQNGESESESEREIEAGWPEERKWAGILLTTMRQQMMATSVLTKDDGDWALTAQGARQFVCQGKDDIKDAGRNAYVAFRVWLASGDSAGWQLRGEDEAQCGGW